MRLSRARRSVGVRFDDPKLVSWVGLAPVMAMAQRCSLAMLLTDRLAIAAKGGAKRRGQDPRVDPGHGLRRGLDRGHQAGAGDQRRRGRCGDHRERRLAGLRGDRAQPHPRRKPPGRRPANRTRSSTAGTADQHPGESRTPDTTRSCTCPATGAGRRASTSSSATSCTTPSHPPPDYPPETARPEHTWNNQTDRQLTHMEVACPAGWAPSLRRGVRRSALYRPAHAWPRSRRSR
jgi:hypothetical protein